MACTVPGGSEVPLDMGTSAQNCATFLFSHSAYQAILFRRTGPMSADVCGRGGKCDPFGATDPAWARHSATGMNWVRLLQPSVPPHGVSLRTCIHPGFKQPVPYQVINFDTKIM